jgi:hypothetical protein
MEIEIKSNLNYPEHNHPHGVKDLQPNEYRIWVCEECRESFNDNYIRQNIQQEWGHECHNCRRFHSTRCESHLEPYLPEVIKELQRPKIVCLCGSTRFSEAFQSAQLEETLNGNIVLTIGCNMKSDKDIFNKYSEVELTEIKRKLDELHKRKIDLANEILILNVGGYIGDSTRSELEYAKFHNKVIRFLENGDLINE